MGRVTEYRTDPDLCELLVTQQPRDDAVDARQGHALHADLGAAGLQDRRQVQVLGRADGRSLGRRAGPGRGADQDRAQERGIADRLRRARAVADRRRRRRQRRARQARAARPSRCSAKAVVLACGGFEANAEMRTRYLGPGWDLAKVRGTRFNTGDGIHMALEIGAMPYGNWSGCHAVGWDCNAPEFGDLAVGDNFQKHSYPFGIMVNANGERFVDEGADFRNYTYAKYGRVILNAARPVRLAGLRPARSSRCCATNTASGRSPRCAPTRSRSWPTSSTTSTPTRRSWRRSSAYNAAVQTDVPFNPNIKDGRGTQRPRDRQIELGEHRSTSRPSRPMRSPAASPSPSAASRSTPSARVHRHRRRADPRPLRGRRAGRRPLLFQLSRRHRPDVGAVFGRIAGAGAGQRATP